jgi:5-(carboxyamino)imidazole ribonucleotide synthase
MADADDQGGEGGVSAAAPVVAMVGAGQLARMTHQAAIPLGVTLRVLADAEGDSAVRSGASHLLGSHMELGDLRRLAEGADVVTFDHEGVPPDHLEALARDGVPLAPGPSAKRLAQDKLHARRRLAEAGFPVPPFAFALDDDDVTAFAAEHGWPLVAKPPRGGYDGRGVYFVDDAAAAAELLQRHPDGLVLEPRLAIERELAVLVARTAGGEHVTYPVVETVQQDGMCREIAAPAPVGDDLAAQAAGLARAIAEHGDVVGLVAVEFFVTREGLLVNELALRPHNSGHYTIEGCDTSQFEQHLRAVLGWPLGATNLTAGAVATVNVIGPADGSDPQERVPAALAIPGVHVHLYGKTARPGRKLGHVTVCGEDPEAVQRTARRAAAVLEGTA